MQEPGLSDLTLKCGIDPGKDQSYFLYFLNQELMRKLVFPLGWFTKEGTRIMAEKAGLVNISGKPDSQDICFRLVEDNETGDEAGFIVDEEGNILGNHKGVQNFTVGQRKGLNISLGYPVYVREIIPETQRVVVAPDDRILAKGTVVTDVTLINRHAIDKIKFRDNMVRAKVRYRSETALARVTFNEGDRAELEFIRPVRAVCPGQAVVFYLHDEALGGGIIDRAIY
jgi:tRNA-specific 2-thiouridylase